MRFISRLKLITLASMSVFTINAEEKDYTNLSSIIKTK